MTTKPPSLSTRTKLDNDAVKDVRMVTNRIVTYIINIPSADDFSLPYAVALAGTVQSAFASKPKRVSGESGKIVVKDVPPGTEVTLFLNSDAHPSYRKKPVYAVTPNDRDVVVTITEKSGKRTETDTPVKTVDKVATVEAAKKADTYTATLNGDIWMKISHKYSTAEVDSLVPADTSAPILAAIKKIYDGLTQASLTLTVPVVAPSTAAKTIAVSFDDGDNPSSNISKGYNALTEGLPRVHPAGYAALFSAAVAANVSKISLTSAWRPMLGSIAHRAGLGLDVNYVGQTRINRAELRIADAVDTTNVSADEKIKFTKFEQSKAKQAAAKKALTKAQAEVNQVANDPAKLIEAKQKRKDAETASTEAATERISAEKAWNEERDKNEPDGVRKFRASLFTCKSVAQLFDPWYMDSNNRDTIPAVANIQRAKNEQLHAHHLHITVYDPKIL